MAEQDFVSFGEFKKIKLVVAEIKEVERVEGTDKLYKLKVYDGTRERTLVAGLAKHYTEEQLKGKKVVIVANLQPREIRGIRSEGMLLAAVSQEKIALLVPDKEVPAGAEIS